MKERRVFKREKGVDERERGTEDRQGVDEKERCTEDRQGVDGRGVLKIERGWMEERY